ncbi:MAG: ABC transporter ATP-binding protein [Chloroflexota bacterium]|nr:MAG: ABC transporter ATP-binding protein [Chloroflexota bacterium]
MLSKKATVPAVCDADLEVNPGEFVIITGRSGSGKTTLLNLAAGLTKPTSGKVILDGAELWELSDKQQSTLRNQKIGFVFQFPSLMPALTSLENVVLPTIFGDNHDRQKATVRALKLLEDMGLSDKLDAYPRQLSAGQQQRVVIARSLINQPELLLADEPTSNLDEQTEREIMSLFKEIHQKSGITILLVTHTNELVPYGTRSVKMASGRIISAH